MEGFAFSKNSKIYDLTLKIDKGGYPSRSDGNKEPFLSGGYKAFENDGFKVKMGEPYHVASYLERLVKQGQNAVYSVQDQSTELLFEEGAVQTNELYTTFMQQYIKNYGLDNVKYSCEMKQKKLQLDSLEKAELELQDKQIYESIWSTPDGSKITWYHNREHLSAGKYLASVLMRYSCRFSEKQAPELGERVFAAHDLLITYFNGNAFAINSKCIERAEEIAIMLQKEYATI